MEKGKETVHILCNLATKDIDAQDVLCNLMWIFKYEVDPGENTEDMRMPRYIFEGSMDVLQESIGKWNFLSDFKYILKEEDGVGNIIKDGVEKKAIVKKQPMNSDDDNIISLYKFYENNIRVDENKQDDIIFYSDDTYNELSFGVRMLCGFIFESDRVSDGTLWEVKTAH